jgi:Protein of unknown function (DUF3570)
MKKICLSVVGLVLSLFSAFAQPAVKDSSQYKSRKLTFEEANLVASYYHQDGNNSAVTGGIGSERLSDYSGAIDLKFLKWDRKERKHSFGFELGLDHYTSASSDKVDLQANSSASSADTRFYPSVNWSMENEKKGTTVGAGLSASNEYDYQSFGTNIHFARKTRNRSGEFTARLQAYVDNLKYILPVELRTGNDNASKARNSFSTSFSYSQVINKNLQLMFLLDLVYQKGYLGLPFHRVYFNDNSVHVENLPGSRFKLPLGFRANYFAGDKVIIRTFYRYYHDDWGLNAHTFELETPVKVTPFFSITPFYRYYNQGAVNYFSPYQKHTAADQYYTSNYDLSTFNSSFYGAGFRIAPPKGVFGMQRFNMLELRYGHYSKSVGMRSDIISLNLKFK